MTGIPEQEYDMLEGREYLMCQCSYIDGVWKVAPLDCQLL